MKNFRWFVLIPMLALLVACSSINHTAPIVDHTTGVRPAAMFAGKPGYYVVQRGDTLSKIARQHKQRPADLIIWNSLSNPNDIKVDQVLRVAPPGQADAITEAQADSVQTRTVEVKPLSSAAPASLVATNKTAPRGEKQPYSESTLAAMQGVTPPATATPQSAGPTGKPAAPLVTPTGGSAQGITWQWPTDGKLIGTFVAGKRTGIDISGRMGQPIQAAAAGRVIHVGPFRGYGNMVILRHSEDLTSVYAHNRQALVKQGDVVAKGQPIAEMGSSDSSAVKLHFEIRRQGGKPVDPLPFLPPK